MKSAIFYLKKVRKERGVTLKELQDKTKIYATSLSRIELGKEEVGEKRSKEIAEALEISEDVIAVYSGKIPKYAYEVYKKYPEKLEKLIRSYFNFFDSEKFVQSTLHKTANMANLLSNEVVKLEQIRFHETTDVVKLLSEIESHGANLQKLATKVREHIESADDLRVLKDEKEEEKI